MSAPDAFQRDIDELNQQSLRACGKGPLKCIFPFGCESRLHPHVPSKQADGTILVSAGLYPAPGGGSAIANRTSTQILALVPCAGTIDWVDVCLYVPKTTCRDVKLSVLKETVLVSAGQGWGGLLGNYIKRLLHVAQRAFAINGGPPVVLENGPDVAAFIDKAIAQEWLTPGSLVNVGTWLCLVLLSRCCLLSLSLSLY
jgi:hypothetical protein